MASPLGDSFPFRNPLAESAASIPSLPVTPGGFPALLDAARQQTELVFWIVRTVQEHEGKLQSLSRQLADQLSVTKLLSEDRKTFRSSKSRNWQAGLGNRGLSRESFHSMDGPSLSQGASSPTDIIDTVEDKTHIEENLGDIAHNLTDKDDEALMPVDGVTTQKEDQEEEEAPQEGRVSQMDSIGEDLEELPRDSARVSGRIISAESPPARRFSFIEGGRRPSTRSLPLQVDPSFAGSLLTEERFADRLEERLQQLLAEDVEHRLEDLAQYIQEEMYHFVLGPDMMERVRQEASNVLSIELAVALAAQDKKMEDLVHSRLQSSLSQVTLTPEVPPEALSSLQQASEEFNELADGLSKRVKLVEENVSELKGLRLQVPDMRNDIDTLQSNLALCVQSIEELEVQQQELVAAGAKPSRNASPTRQLLSPSGSAADEVTAEDLAEHPEVQPVAVPEPTSPVPSPSMVREASPETVKPKRRLSDMLGVYMPPAPKQPALEDSQVQELVASTENMKNRLDQMEQLVGTETSSRRNSLQNKINDVDTLASILEDRMRELDNEFRSNNQKVQSQLDVLLAAHETQQAEDLRHNKTWNLANQVDVILSVINSEMRNLRSDFDQKLSSAIIGKPESKGDGTNEAPKGEVQDLEDKVKRLQDNQQQSMLKIAGLRSAHKHAEAQANFALEKLKRLQAEVGGIVDQVVAQQTRLDYLLVHGAAMQQSKDSSFKTIVSVGEQEKKPKLKGGATMPTRPLDKVPTDAGGPDVAKFDTTSDEVNASRIAKMGKRLLELDGEVNRTIVELRGEVQTVNKTLLAFLELLPRRLRRMLQRQLFPEQSEEDAGEIKVEFKSDEGKRHVTFGDQVETRTYTVEEDDSRLPWQLAGEPDIKWSWCFKPRDEMGKDLAMCLEQFETERDDFEAKIVQWLQHGGVPPPVASKGAPGWSRASLHQSDGMIGSFPEDAAVVAPQMMHMEDRLERLGSEFFNLKRAQDNDHVRKADKEEVQQLLARLTFFEKLNIPDLKIRIESLEGDTKFTAQNVSDISEKLYKVESVAVPRSELVKVQNGFEDLRSDHQVMKMELKELSATTYNSNRKFTHEMAEVKTWTQQAVVGLQKNKADHPDVAQLSEKVGKLESSIKDNRRILGDGGGQEINAVVRRIILNLEDKIMVLEKKIDALAHGRPKDTLQSKGDMSPSHQQSASYQSTEMQEAAVQSISEELSVMTEAVSKLKQDISVSKVHIDEMTEQGHQNLELASRLHVLVQSTALEGMDDEGTALSLTRVQVMIAAAARQLVAGSKWITKETFDSRMELIRGEYFKEIRMMQGRLEELTMKAQQAAPLQVNMQAVPAKLPKMIFQKVQSQGQATPAQSEVDRLGTAPGGTRPQPMSARGLRPATEGRPRGRQGHQ